jgi:hypothetical protein
MGFSAAIVLGGYGALLGFGPVGAAVGATVGLLLPEGGSSGVGPGGGSSSGGSSCAHGNRRVDLLRYIPV